MLSANNESPEVTELLLKHGAADSINIVSKFGYTALTIAVLHSKITIAEFLSSAHADVSIRYRGKTVLMLAAKCLEEDMVKLLLSYKYVRKIIDELDYDQTALTYLLEGIEKTLQICYVFPEGGTKTEEDVKSYIDDGLILVKMLLNAGALPFSESFCDDGNRIIKICQAEEINDLLKLHIDGRRDDIHLKMASKTVLSKFGATMFVEKETEDGTVTEKFEGVKLKGIHMDHVSSFLTGYTSLVTDGAVADETVEKPTSSAVAGAGAGSSMPCEVALGGVLKTRTMPGS